ncbi:GNAT family N-acetyltransferase [Phototrophicus methaneseepsis]|uniref:GNAT family N-acetyltransferase n=1 Tax=Phototrophicus methaneseepsis TaxID=2710758 RepID=A0A7S8E6Q3_9CHLR|nr:GNAT family N-acetyltransferase [Phototrophicus methaneseepsis]QPC81350.1 GNAT family N-acetyltransferase [Phototrophicus methaneseepsis]
MTINQISLQELTDLNDDLLLPWLDLYEISFPPNEKELVSSKLGLLKSKMAGEKSNKYMLAAIDQENSLVGLVNYQTTKDANNAILWYLAVQPELRSKGFGSIIYREFTRSLNTNNIHALFFEVEIPELAHTAEEQDLARRRIEFYRRLGAKVLTGIHYLQYIGPHLPPTPMHIMVQPFNALEVQEIFNRAKGIFGDTLEQVSDLDLA